jgi:hypothetical protein
MSKFAALFALLVAALACGLFAAPALAQRARVFVASYGSDSNPCTFGSPCKTFQQAVNVVAVGGEVTAIDSAGFGPIIINKAVSITSPNGVEAGIVSDTGGAVAIQINAGTTDLVKLRGLTLNGGGMGYAGVYLASAGGLTIENCVIQDFNGAGGGVVISPNSSVSVVITHSAFAHNDGGIYIYQVPPGSVNMVVDHNVFTDNQYGIDISAEGNGTIASISNSTASNNTVQGILVEGTASVSIDNDTVSNNPTGILAKGTSRIVLGRSAITNNTNYGIDNETSPNTCYTYQNNQINLNGSNNTVNGSIPNDLTFQ